MANIHAVQIEGVLPFHWATDLTEEEASIIVSWFLSPVVGIKFEFLGSAGHVPSEEGGVTTLFFFQVTGEEAIWESGVEKIVQIFRRLGTVKKARCRDIENNGNWIKV